MQIFLLIVLLFAANFSMFAQEQFPKNQISINGFRNPSIGLEYQQKQVSIHAGYYLTNFTSGVTTEFLKTGVSYWFLPNDSKEMPSSFYVGTSYLRGLTREYENSNAFAVETGYRWYVWEGLNLRLGIIVLAAKQQSLKINPTPSISYSINF